MAANPGDEVRVAVEAMATRFELVMHGGDPVRLRAAGEEALAEIERLDAQLSAFRPASDISWINARAAKAPVEVEPRLFALLDRCRALSALTGGAFDITVAPLVCVWNFDGKPGVVPDEKARTAATASVGWAGLFLDRASSTVRFAKPAMRLDLGAVGRGYAIDRAIEILRGHGVTSALLHGGTGSAHAIGRSNGVAWNVAWEPSPGESRRFALENSALSVSAIHGKSFVAGGRTYGHVIDPRSGHPTSAARSAVVVGPGSLECDALSTALLVQGSAWLPAFRQRFPGYEAYIDSVAANPSTP